MLLLDTIKNLFGLLYCIFIADLFDMQTMQQVS